MNNIYIGNRYVPIFANPVEWDNLREYEPLTIVTYNGTAYTSRQFVPVGTALSNTDYWVVTGNYNAQVEQYRQEVASLSDEVNNLDSGLDNAVDRISALELGTSLGIVVCIGDSYLEGYTPSGNVTSWGDRLATYLGKTVGTTLRKYYKGGSGFGVAVDGKDFNALVNDAYSDIGSSSAGNVGAVIIVGGANESSSITMSDVADTLANARSKFTNAKVYYAYGSNYKNQAPYNRVAVLEQYCRGISGNVGNTFFMGDITNILKNYPQLYATDNTHLTETGYRVLAKYILNAMFGYGVKVSRKHHTFETNFIEYMCNDVYVLELFNPKSYTLEASEHISNGETLLYSISVNTYLCCEDNNFYVARTNGYVKTSDNKFHNVTFTLRIFPNKIDVYDYGIADDGSNYVTGTITAFQMCPFTYNIPVGII